MKIAIVTDSWHPLRNGVVTTLTALIPRLEERGHEVRVFHPHLFKTMPVPTYPEIRVALVSECLLAPMLSEYRPDAIHIVTECPMGLAGRRYCLKRKLNFTTSYTTRFDEHFAARIPIPKELVRRWLRWFHSAAAGTTVSTPSLEAELTAQGFKNLVRWGRGVDLSLFQPGSKDLYDLPRPISVNVGRVSAEKNLETFLDMNIPGTKVIIGDGPSLAPLKQQYPEVVFLGYLTGQDLADHLAAADIMVFPSVSETFGVVMIEAMACGLPVAAYPVMGPIDVVEQGVSGWLSEDLRQAFDRALELDPEDCRRHALQFTLDKCCDQFEAALVPVK